MAGLGLFGGSFNPPHLGHLILAMEAWYQLNLDKILWILTPDSPLKQGQPKARTADRLDMVRAAIAGNPAFEISLVETQRPGPHYTLDTLRLIRAEYPDHELAYLMGGDSLMDLPAWHRPDEFVGACDWLGIMRRPGDEFTLEALADEFPGLAPKIRMIKAPLLEISSRDLRRRVAQRGPLRYYLPAEVLKIIQERQLYR